VKPFIATFLIVFVASTAFAGNGKDNDKKAPTYSFQGKVLDGSNAEALTGATIKIVELEKTVYADWRGSFNFENIPSGSYTVEISFVSYSTKTLENFQIDDDVKSDFLL